MRQPLLKRIIVVRLGRILNMLYKPSELANEIGVTVDTICRSYIPAGLPHSRDANGNIWIYGPAFVGWAKETITKKRSRRQGLRDGYGWCVKCNYPVMLTAPRIRTINRYIELLQSPCPQCRTTVNRARARQNGDSQ